MQFGFDKLPVPSGPREPRLLRINMMIDSGIGSGRNRANLEWDELYITEMVRRGMAVDTSHGGGACLSAGLEAGQALW